MKSAKIFNKFSKPNGKACAHDFRHLGAALFYQALVAIGL